MYTAMANDRRAARRGVLQLLCIVGILITPSFGAPLSRGGMVSHRVLQATAKEADKTVTEGDKEGGDDKSDSDDDDKRNEDEEEKAENTVAFAEPSFLPTLVGSPSLFPTLTDSFSLTTTKSPSTSVVSPTRQEARGLLLMLSLWSPNLNNSGDNSTMYKLKSISARAVTRAICYKQSDFGECIVRDVSRQGEQSQQQTEGHSVMASKPVVRIRRSNITSDKNDGDSSLSWYVVRMKYSVVTLDEKYRTQALSRDPALEGDDLQQMSHIIQQRRLQAYLNMQILSGRFNSVLHTQDTDDTNLYASPLGSEIDIFSTTSSQLKSFEDIYVNIRAWGVVMLLVALSVYVDLVWFARKRRQKRQLELSLQQSRHEGEGGSSSGSVSQQ